MTNWHWVAFENTDERGAERQIKPHAMSDATREGVVYELESRDCKVSTDEPTTSLSIDLPGMVCVDRPWESFTLRGLVLDIPSEDLASFAVELNEAKPRTSLVPTSQVNVSISDRESMSRYVKLHAWLRCLCLSPDEAAELAVLFRERIPSAERRASEFYATRKLPSEVLREAAARTTGAPIESVPNLGGNRVDRFRLKPGGQA